MDLLGVFIFMAGAAIFILMAIYVVILRTSREEKQPQSILYSSPRLREWIRSHPPEKQDGAVRHLDWAITVAGKYPYPIDDDWIETFIVQNPPNPRLSLQEALTQHNDLHNWLMGHADPNDINEARRRIAAELANLPGGPDVQWVLRFIADNPLPRIVPEIENSGYTGRLFAIADSAQTPPSPAPFPAPRPAPRPSTPFPPPPFGRQSSDLL